MVELAPHPNEDLTQKEVNFLLSVLGFKKNDDDLIVFFNALPVQVKWPSIATKIRGIDSQIANNKLPENIANLVTFFGDTPYKEITLKELAVIVEKGEKFRDICKFHNIPLIEFPPNPKHEPKPDKINTNQGIPVDLPDNSPALEPSLRGDAFQIIDTANGSETSNNHKTKPQTKLRRYRDRTEVNKNHKPVNGSPNNASQLLENNEIPESSEDDRQDELEDNKSYQKPKNVSNDRFYNLPINHRNPKIPKNIIESGRSNNSNQERIKRVALCFFETYGGDYKYKTLQDIACEVYKKELAKLPDDPESFLRDCVVKITRDRESISQQLEKIFSLPSWIAPELNDDFMQNLYRSLRDHDLYMDLDANTLKKIIMRQISYHEICKLQNIVDPTTLKNFTLT